MRRLQLSNLGVIMSGNQTCVHVSIPIVSQCFWLGKLGFEATSLQTHSFISRSHDTSGYSVKPWNCRYVTEEYSHVVENVMIGQWQMYCWQEVRKRWISCFPIRVITCLACLPGHTGLHYLFVRGQCASYWSQSSVQKFFCFAQGWFLFVCFSVPCGSKPSGEVPC